jgi:O-antigen/teichoic acid export membrane protein
MSSIKRMFSAFRQRHFHQGRGGRAKLAATGSLLTRIVTTAASFLVLPITIRYLGNDGYGLMAVMTSVVGWLQFSTFGIGTALQNPLTVARVEQDVARQRELISTAFFSLAAIGLLLLAIIALAFPWVDWLTVFPPDTDRFTREVPAAFAMVFLAFVSTLVLSFIGPVYAARQELHLGNIPVLTASFLTLGGILAATYWDLGLMGVVVASVGIPAAAQWTFAIWTMWLRGIPELAPRISDCSRRAWHALLRRGLEFQILQLCNIAFFHADLFIIAHMLSTEEVTPYSVGQRVFTQVAGLFALATGSLWSAYGDAKASRDFEWIRRGHRRMAMAFVLLFSGLAAGMLLFGHVLLSWWVGEAAAPSTVLIAAMVCYYCAREWTALNTMLLNGLDIIRPQVWVLFLTAILSLGLGIALVRTWGVIGLPLGGFAGFALLSAWYLPLLAKRSLRQMEATERSGAPACGVVAS